MPFATTVEGHPREWPDDPRMPGLSLAQAFVIYTRRRSPRMFALGLAALFAARWLAGPITVWDVALFAGLVLLQPFSEWVIHVGILHWRPRRVFGWTVDTYLSWSHREHHKLPHDERWWFIPLRSGFVGTILIGTAAWILLQDWSLWLTWMLTALLIAGVYEWTHFLCHSSYRPRSRLYKRIWRHHRWHHFKNEHYWMGVSRHLADWVLRTNPSPKDVPTSPSCRDLLAGMQPTAHDAD
jgi:hypothetical protein